MNELDQFDLQILEILQKNNLTPQRDIGEHIGLSAAAVQRRIKRMRETGIVKADVSVIDTEKVKHSVTLIVEVFLERDKIDLIDQAQRLFTSAPEVQQCYYVTGESDFVLIIVVSSMKDYEQLTRRIFYGNDNIKHFRTLVSMNTVKSGLEIPINMLL
ncbi:MULTISPECIES: Lrp/AsnC family transcriptional regulator [Chryseobacterium]|uniref:Lrp/AsnC family transcriptional regulator n=1 Tax=Chryseobacterium TaxID=59732 RepID=UPI0011D5B5E8|nr:MULTISPECIES: Lrp/AsnC family transcriptional regulator [Chryseobacterium]UVT37979.1 Leucine-responsive regulatory protein [uncultured bacterium]MDH5033147.1 Lrp/AsnC family transcriptional regulator [Chryseobacterium cucumeris]MDQ1856334.1 Lrp/AsnC family transcriptional regulator [Chryseobacterium sp. WLY505]QRA42838.1 Lrp/AsnC family transcriptional regulator [Chryseobacterium cucumeris]TXJ00490.1 MAG: Lrp/AsnC family transcriptional regulator [Chryseobacterium cucumeris]